MMAQVSTKRTSAAMMTQINLTHVPSSVVIGTSWCHSRGLLSNRGNPWAAFSGGLAPRRWRSAQSGKHPIAWRRSANPAGAGTGLDAGVPPAVAAVAPSHATAGCFCAWRPLPTLRAVRLRLRCKRAEDIAGGGDEDSVLLADQFVATG